MSRFIDSVVFYTAALIGTQSKDTFHPQSNLFFLNNA